MNNENVVMNLTANADFSNLVTSVNRITASLLKMQEQTSSLTATLLQVLQALLKVSQAPLVALLFRCAPRPA
jgi:hypothetical protein